MKYEIYYLNKNKQFKTTILTDEYMTEKGTWYSRDCSIIKDHTFIYHGDLL